MNGQCKTVWDTGFRHCNLDRGHQLHAYRWAPANTSSCAGDRPCTRADRARDVTVYNAVLTGAACDEPAPDAR
jgi:hypothetical protein